MASIRRFLLRLGQTALPLLLVGAVAFTLREPLDWWLHGDQIYDQEAIKEWLREARVFSTLPELAGEYLELVGKHRKLAQQIAQLKQTGKANELKAAEGLAKELRDTQLPIKSEEIHEHLKALCNPPTKMYPEQLPLFPMIYRLNVTFDPGPETTDLKLPPIIWDSELPREISQYRELDDIPLYPGVTARIQYHLHAYSEKQSQERQEVRRRLRLGVLTIVCALSALVWVYFSQRRERRRERRVNEAERLRLEEELRRQEAEHRRQEVERQNLELRSQIFVNIGIMAGSYAHNIKNLLVRPNDLLRRCLEETLKPEDREHLLREVKQTLATVTDRLQQILQTVRRDPGKVETVRIDLNHLAREMCQTWADLARDKWKLVLELDAEAVTPTRRAGEEHPTPAKGEPGASATGAFWIEGDYSHMQQALENLLFNARDATFEMRNHLREQARHPPSSPAAQGSRAAEEQRQALIAAAGWKGHVIIRTRRLENRAVLEVEDNGIGMAEEVRRRCTETHFSTKRNNALFAGLSAGMGLGLAFVAVILEHHGGSLEIVSQPLAGATFRLTFPLAS